MLPCSAVRSCRPRFRFPRQASIHLLGIPSGRNSAKPLLKVSLHIDYRHAYTVQQYSFTGPARRGSRRRPTAVSTVEGLEKEVCCDRQSFAFPALGATDGRHLPVRQSAAACCCGRRRAPNSNPGLCPNRASCIRRANSSFRGRLGYCNTAHTRPILPQIIDAAVHVCTWVLSRTGTPKIPAAAQDIQAPCGAPCIPLIERGTRVIHRLASNYGASAVHFFTSRPSSPGPRLPESTVPVYIFSAPRPLSNKPRKSRHLSEDAAKDYSSRIVPRSLLSS